MQKIVVSPSFEIYDDWWMDDGPGGPRPIQPGPPGGGGDPGPGTDSDSATDDGGGDQTDTPYGQDSDTDSDSSDAAGYTLSPDQSGDDGTTDGDCIADTPVEPDPCEEGCGFDDPWVYE